MNTFEPMFRLEVRHDFYAPAPPPVTLEADAATRRLAAGQHLRLRTGPGLAEAFCTADRTVLKMIAEDEGLHLTFRLRATDPDLIAVTDVLSGARGQVVVLEADTPAAGPLHDAGEVRTTDLQALAEGDVITRPDTMRPPLAIIRLSLDPDTRDTTWFVRFAAPERFLTYNIYGGAEDANFSIRDTDDHITFKNIEPRSTGDGRTFRRFRSTTPVAARARSAARYELLSEGPFGNRVVIPVLPVPSASMTAIDPSGDPPGLNTDLYVNL